MKSTAWSRDLSHIKRRTWETCHIHTQLSRVRWRAQLGAETCHTSRGGLGRLVMYTHTCHRSRNLVSLFLNYPGLGLEVIFLVVIHCLAVRSVQEQRWLVTGWRFVPRIPRGVVPELGWCAGQRRGEQAKTTGIYFHLHFPREGRRCPFPLYNTLGAAIIRARQSTMSRPWGRIPISTFASKSRQSDIPLSYLLSKNTGTSFLHSSGSIEIAAVQ